MQSETLAILSAAMFGLSTPLARRGLQRQSVVTGTLVTTLMTTLVLAVPGLLFFEVPALSARPLIYLALTGVFGSALGRLAALTGVARLGASVSGPIQGTYPLFATGLAVAFLGESLTVARASGAVLVVAGVVALMTRGQPPHLASKPPPRLSVVFPLLAALLYAATDTLTRAALRELPHPLFGASVSYLCASLFVVCGVVLAPPLRQSVSLAGRSTGWFVLAGSVQGLAVLTLYAALSLGEVVLVSPIIGATPLFVLLWSLLLLRRLESLRWETVLGGLLVVAGIAVLSLA